MDKAAQILDFWFQSVDDNTPANAKDDPFKKWFMKNEQFDREIKEKFEADVIKARWGTYKAWESSAAGRLALILLYDQFCRNMFRNTPRMFENDPLALDLTLRSIQEGQDKGLYLIQRTFLYMPLMHSEQRSMQELSVKYFSTLVDESREKVPQNAGYYEYSLGYAKKHRDIVERFGRFPHRNRILGRMSTPEEEDFLTKPGSAF